MNEGAAYYARRKIGEKKGFAYFLSSLSPLFILLLITAALSFSLSFIISMSEGIDKLLAVMGSGSVRILSYPDSSLLPEGAEISETKTGTALLYAENGENAVMVKGIGEDYLEGIRKSVLDIEYSESEGINPRSILSMVLHRKIYCFQKGRMLKSLSLHYGRAVFLQRVTGLCIRRFTRTCVSR